MTRKKEDDRLNIRIEKLEQMSEEGKMFAEENTEDDLDDEIEIDPEALKKWLKENPAEKRALTPDEEQMLRQQARDRTARHNKKKPS